MSTNNSNDNNNNNNNNNNSNNINNYNNDSFIDSMTFASGAATRRSGNGGGGFGFGCDCDDCGITTTTTSSGTGTSTTTTSNIPGPILMAMREHKRQRLETGPLKRTQERTLICRHSLTSSLSLTSTTNNSNTLSSSSSSLAIWKWTMPFNAEPLIEYGSTHRLVYVETLPKHSMLRSIGTGIIGSSDEENTRIDLSDWIEGQMYFIPSNGGKAIGFIHTNSSSSASASASPTNNTGTTSSSSTTTTTTAGGGGHAILQIVKIPVEALSNNDIYNAIHQEGWITMMLQLCRKVLPNDEEKSNNNNDGKTSVSTSTKEKKYDYYPLPKEYCPILRRSFQEAGQPSNSFASSKSSISAPTPPPPPPLPQQSSIYAARAIPEPGVYFTPVHMNGGDGNASPEKEQPGSGNPKQEEA